MRSTPSIAADVAQWAATTLTEIRTVNPWPTTENPGEMPHLSVDVLSATAGVSPPGDAPSTAHRQSTGRLLAVVLEVLVQPLPIGEQMVTLWTMGDRLIRAQQLDRTLGKTLHATPVQCAFPGLVTLNDGTEALALHASLSVWISP